MDETLAGFKERLATLGLTATIGHAMPTRHGVREAEVRLARGDSTQGYSLLYGPVVRLTDVAKAGGSDLPRLVFTSLVAPKTAETFRRAGTQYLDTGGNAWIEFGDVLIDVRGRRPDRKSTDAVPRVRAGNLFSSGRSQVVFALLAWPQLWDAPRRELAHASGVSVGQAHNTLELLAEAGYEAGQARLRQTDLLDIWAAAFPTNLAKRLTLATYRSNVERMQKVNAEGPVFLSGESADGVALRPATLTLYVEKLRPDLAVNNRWRTDGEPNVVIRRKFWHAPRESADYDDLQTGLRNAPWPLVYADLAASDDPRVRSAATEWRHRFA